MAQVCGLGQRIGGRLALFYIHRVNRLYPCSDLMDMLRCLINCRIIIIIMIINKLGLS